MYQVDEDANLQRALVDDYFGPAPNHKVPPALRRKAEVDVGLHVGPPRVHVCMLTMVHMFSRLRFCVADRMSSRSIRRNSRAR